MYCRGLLGGVADLVADAMLGALDLTVGSIMEERRGFLCKAHSCRTFQVLEEKEIIRTKCNWI